MIKTENLTKKYGAKDNCIYAVQNVTLEVEEGEFVSVVGCSGSGKTTLLHLLGGIAIPDNGKVLFDNTNFFSMTADEQAVFRRDNIGVIYQSYNLMPTLTVKENILLPCMLARKTADKEYFASLIYSLGLENRLNCLPHQLSGGQQQRTAIGRAMINRPKIILADEPTGNLDTQNSNQIIDIMRQSNANYKQTFLLVTHNPALAESTTRTITINDGEIISDEKR